jgi:SAM-dependent methyltransferase
MRTESLRQRPTGRPADAAARPAGGVLQSLRRKLSILFSGPGRRPFSYTKDREPRGGLLVYYSEPPTEEFWTRYWEDETGDDSSPLVREAAPDMGPDLVAAAMPRHGKVLEAGCGAGRIVQAMRAKGIDCEGVDWSPDVVSAVRASHPDLPVRVGNVLALDVPDGHYAGCISLGVIEHRREGPEPFLAEAYRALAPDGVLAVSVPCYSPVRRLKAACGLIRRTGRRLPFFKYAMTPEVLRSYVRRAGFEPFRTHYLDAHRGLSEEVRWVHLLPAPGGRLRRWLSESRAARRALGHMVLVVARKCLYRDGPPPGHAGARTVNPPGRPEERHAPKPGGPDEHAIEG